MLPGECAESLPGTRLPAEIELDPVTKDATRLKSEPFDEDDLTQYSGSVASSGLDPCSGYIGNIRNFRRHSNESS